MCCLYECIKYVQVPKESEYSVKFPRDGVTYSYELPKGLLVIEAEPFEKQATRVLNW